MKELYTKNMRIGASMCDFKAKLSMPHAFRICMDAATEHAQMLGVGFDYMLKNNCYWITAKTRIHVHSFPGILDEINVNTWPLEPKGPSCIRDYRIEGPDGKLFLTGKTEWIMRDNASGRLLPGADVFAANFPFHPETVLDEPFSKAEAVTDSYQQIGEYTVASTDIDLGQHMNNTAYIEALFRMFSTEEIQKRHYTDIEILYKKPCYEGEKLRFYELTESGMTKITIWNAENETAAFVILQ